MLTGLGGARDAARGAPAARALPPDGGPPPGAALVRPLASLAYLEECTPADRALGEDGYALVSLRGAATHAVGIARARAAGGGGAP